MNTLKLGGVVVAALCVCMPSYAGPIDLSTGSPVAGDANLRLWLDASDLSTLWQDTGATIAAADTFDVALWKDKSGNGKDVSNTDAVRRPTYAASVGNLGSKPALQFVGGSASDMLFRANDLGIAGNADRTVVTVWQSTGFTGQNYQHTFHMGDQTGNEAYGHSASRAGNAGSPISNHYWGDGFDSTATATLLGARVAVSSWDGDGGTGANGLDSWWVNGAPAGASDRAALATGTDQLKIGSRLNGGTAGTEGFTGDLAEVIVFDTVLTTDERNALVQYIENKYSFATVFADDFSEANGTVVNGKAPDVGGANWNQTVGANVTIQGGAIETQGGAREIIGTFTRALSAGDIMTMTIESLESGGNVFSTGFAGISLYDGANELLFVGDVADSTAGWAAAALAAGPEVISSGKTSEVATVVFTYNFDTGAASLTIDGGTTFTGVLPANAAVDSLKIWNQGGGDIKIDSINVVIPEPATLSLLALGMLGLVARRRRR